VQQNFQGCYRVSTVHDEFDVSCTQFVGCRGTFSQLVCENSWKLVLNSFSALTRILHPRHQSMKHQRKVQLILLAFEKSLTRNIDLNAFVDRFNAKTRRIILWTLENTIIVFCSAFRNWILDIINNTFIDQNENQTYICITYIVLVVGGHGPSFNRELGVGPKFGYARTTQSWEIWRPLHLGP